MNKCLCPKCNSKLEERIGNMTHIIFEKEVVVKNVPYTYCPKCMDSSYADVHKVDILIRDAYREGKSVVEFY